MGAASGGQRAKGGRKNRKHGCNKDWCKQYAARGTAERNRVVRLARFLRRHPENTEARAALAVAWTATRGRPPTDADLAGMRIVPLAEAQG